MDERQKIKSELVEKLKTISQDREFILGVISNAKHDDDRKEIINYIDKGEGVTYEQLLLLSVWLSKERKRRITMIEKISTSNAPAAIGPYCQAMKVNGMVFTSGQLGLDPATGDFAGDDVTAQAEAALKNLGAILKEAGTDYDKIVKTTCFLADMADFAAFNAVYAKYITNTPARSCVAVKTLPKGGLVEVEAIAVL